MAQSEQLPEDIMLQGEIDVADTTAETLQEEGPLESEFTPTQIGGSVAAVLGLVAFGVIAKKGHDEMFKPKPVRD